MIRDPNDPTGLGLFSKYGRNHAAKETKSRPKTANKINSSHIEQADFLNEKANGNGK